MVANAFPELNLKVPKPPSVPHNHWKNITNQQAFLESFASKYSIMIDLSLLTHSYIKNPRDWYFVLTNEVKKNGGAGLLQNYYKGSLIRALQAVYPQTIWNSWRFSQKSPHGTRKSKHRFSKKQYLLYQHIQHVSASSSNAHRV